MNIWWPKTPGPGVCLEGTPGIFQKIGRPHFLPDFSQRKAMRTYRLKWLELKIAIYTRHSSEKENPKQLVNILFKLLFIGTPLWNLHWNRFRTLNSDENAIFVYIKGNNRYLPVMGENEPNFWLISSYSFTNLVCFNLGLMLLKA